MERTINRQKNIIEILQAVDCHVKSNLDTKLFEIEKLQNKYTIHELCDALQVASVVL